MTVYFDTRLIVKLYVREETTPRAVTLFDASEAPPLCHWQRFEAYNAIRLKRFRGEITPRQMRGSLTLFEGDVGRGVWDRRAVDTELLFRRAEALSAEHSSELGTRSMDVVHVAAALLLGVDAFASFDERQLALAQRAGLSVLSRA